MNKKDYNNIMSEFYGEFLQIELQKAKRVLGLDYNVIIISDRDSWNNRFPTNKISSYSAKNNLMGKTFITELPEFTGIYFYINADRIKTLNELTYLIWHELLHHRYPKMSEAQIRKKVREYI